MVSTIGLSSTYRSGIPLTYYSGTPFACCLWSPSALFDRSTMRVLRGGASVLGGGATGALSSSDHSNTAALYPSSGLITAK